MKRSAASSSSAVVTPGRALRRSMSWQRTSTRPAAAIFSISSGLLRMIAIGYLELRLETEGRERRPHVVVDLLRRPRAVEAAQEALVLVVLDQRLGLLVVDGESVADRLRLVVVPLDQPRAVLVADAVVLRGVELDVVDVLVLHADPPPGQAPDHLLVRDVDQEGGGQRAPVLPEGPVEHLRLLGRARKAVEQESVLALVRVDPLD